MDKKKLIGTIVGVVAFIALIAGATFAWFTYDITLNKAGYNFTSKNFSIVYSNGGNNITGVSTYNGTPSDTTGFTGPATGKVDISVNTVSGSLDGQMTIYMYVNTATADQIITTGAVRYAVIEDGSSYTLSTTPYKGNLQSATVSTIEGHQNALATGITVTSTQKTYHVYIWLDASLLDSTIPENAQFSGYIGASAAQATAPANAVVLQ